MKINYYGLYTLFKKEIFRFGKVSLQTIFAPVLTTLLYLLIFSQAISGKIIIPEVEYVQFLIPGLVMMSMLQNAFSNSSSSLIQSKLGGNLILILLPPLSHKEFFIAYTAAAIVRGLVVGLCLMLITIWIELPPIKHLLWIIAFAFLACLLMASLGLLAGIVAEKYDQMALFQNFIIIPLTFLSGVFYSIHSLPNFWYQISLFNPLFYLIDGFRYGFFGYSDIPIMTSFLISCAFSLSLVIFVLFVLKSGYKLKN